MPHNSPMKSAMRCLLLTLLFFTASFPASASAGTITYSYDNTSQLTGAVFANSTSSVSYNYDKSGNRITYIENAPDHGGTPVSVSSSIHPLDMPYIGPNSNIITGKGYGSGIQKIEVSTDGGKTWSTTGVTDTSDAGTGPYAKWKFTWASLPADGKYYVMSRATSTMFVIIEIPFLLNIG